jgi:4-amino-4-deoxy-L-arabinose transferase-like glycosyltransferase
VNNPNPALVTQRGARRLPRLPLLLLCAAYLLPGVFDRDPWRNADLIAYGQMAAIAEGRTPWWAPALGGVPGDAALLPHWLGATFITLLSPAVGSSNAARIPFMLLLALTMALVWYTTFHLARTEAAQPVAFAFGGEADPVDYARAIADGAVLALIATLGLLQLGHETTPELAQLFGVGLYLWALASAPFRVWQPRAAAVASLVLLAGSGAPTIALALGAGGLVVCRRSSYAEVRRFAPWVAAATLAAALLATAFGAWRLRTTAPAAGDLLVIARQWAWFLWPAWPLVLWTLWRWRNHLLHRHLSVPLVAVIAALVANVAMKASDRALMLALPGMAVLAAFALPTLKRSAAAAIDWFSMFFFSGCAITVWVLFAAMQTGVPARFARNVARALPGFVAGFDALQLVLAVAGTVAWLWLVRWRTGRHREAVWKSMVLPAGGVALCWLLGMTLWLAPLDYARSSRPLVDRIAAYVPHGACIAGPALSPVQVAALEVFGGYRVDARPGAARDDCEFLVQTVPAKAPQPPPGWAALATVQGPRDRDDATAVYRRQARSAAAAPAR